MKTVTIRVPRKGIATGQSAVTIDASGFQGQGCKTATEAFAMLGQEIETENKPELYQMEDGVERLQEGE